MSDTLYKCTVCGRVGTVGRCCGDETREPLNDLAREEQKKIKSQNLSEADPLLAEVRALIMDSNLKWNNENEKLYIAAYNNAIKDVLKILGEQFS